jgi:hypothetical protein
MIQSFHRGLRAMAIAAHTSPGVYGTAHTIKGARSLSATLNLEVEELRGDDVVLDQHAKLISVTFTLAYAAVDLSALDILMGGTLVSNASYEDFLMSQDDNVPYFAVAGRVVGSGGTNDLHIFAGRCRASGNLQYQAQLDTYIIPSLEIKAVYEDGIGICRFRNFTAPTALEIPLRTSTGGL